MKKFNPASEKSIELRYQGVDGLQARATHRIPRATSLIHNCLNSALQSASDPLLASLRISKVELAPDFSQALIWFFSIETEAEKIAKQQKKLQRASAFLKHYLSKNILLRRIPTLHFKADLNGIELKDYEHYHRLNSSERADS